MRLNPFGNKRTFTNSTDLASIPLTNLSQQYTTPGMLMRSSYDNGFAPVSAISDEVLKRNIRLGDINNPESDVTASYQIWNAFSRPNDRMNFLMFIDSLVAGFLTLPEYSLLVWHVTPTGEVNPGAPDEGFTLDNIIGFTAIREECKTYDSRGLEEWQIDFGSSGGTRKFHREDVMTLRYSVLPDDGVTGVSPGSASSQEAAIRDRLNQQQRALFDNGATPSLIVTIHARSHEEASTIQQAYERKNRGAAKAGGVVYQTVIDNAMLSGMGEPKIVITPVGTSNNDLAIKEIVEFTENTITSNYGVSPIIYGDATTTTFQNQELANSKFMDRVQSILVRLCSNIENELARLVSLEDLPFTFVWDDVEFDLTQEQEIRAKTQAEQTRSYLALIQAGVTPLQAATVLGLDDSWAAIDAKPVAAPVVSPGEPVLQNMLEGCTCPKNVLPPRVSTLEESAQKKIVNLLKKIAKEIYDGSKSNALPAVNEYDQQLIDELTKVMSQGGQKAGQQLLNDIDTGRDLVSFATLTEQQRDLLLKRTSKIVSNYVEFVSEKLASLPVDDPVRKTFTLFYNTSVVSRAKLIGQQEIKVAYQNGQLNVAENIQGWLSQNKPQSSIVKTWATTSAQPCVFCEGMNGRQAGIRDSFVPGGLLDGSNDVTFFLDPEYSDGTIPDAHANCQCVFEFKLVSK